MTTTALTGDPRTDRALLLLAKILAEIASRNAAETQRPAA